MLIRVRGGNAGIKEYLEKGVKNGRDLTRDELDQRIVLDGDLSLTGAVINSIEGEAQKYLHITLSFKEDQLDESTLKGITEDFKAFAMKAYQSDEYAFYAEAHIPKIKSYIDKSTGETVDRKPHIHIVIPQKNLKTDKRLKPFDYDKQNERYIDAFQEVTNEKYGLASPKQHVRQAFIDEGSLISRHKGDIFPSLNREIKSQALAILLKEDISTQSQFIEKLDAKGFEVTVRNQGKSNEYINIKPPDKKKGVNLKESVFRETFISLPKAEKQDQLENQYKPYCQEENTGYQATTKHHADLQEWYKTRAYELRYVHRRNREEYKRLTPEQKQDFLTQKKAYVDNGKPLISRASFDSINRAIRTAAEHLRDAERYSECIKPGVRNLNNRRAIRDAIANIERHAGNQNPTEPKRGSSDTLSQMRCDIQSAALPDINQIKKQIDALSLLQSLARTHALQPDKYLITKAKDGSDRVRCGNHNLNAGDFLTKEMHFSWKEAKQYLERSYQEQNISHYKPHPPKECIEPNIIRAAWQSQLQTERETKQDYLRDYRIEKKAIYSDTSLSKEDRKAALSIAQMNKVILDIQFKQETKKARDELIANPIKTKNKRPLIMKTNINKKTDNTITIKTLNHYLEASRVMYHYPEFAQKGITVGNVSKSAIGDRIEIDGKKLSVTSAVKEIKGLENKAVIKELTPIYLAQEKDKARVDKYVAQQNNEKTSTPTHQGKEKEKEKTEEIKNEPLNNTISSGVAQEKIIDSLSPELKERWRNAEQKIMTTDTEKTIIDRKNNFMNNERKTIAEMDQDRIYPQENAENSTETISRLKKETTNDIHLPEKMLDESITHGTNKDGHVAYYLGDDKIVTDRGKDVLIEQQSDKAIEIGLRLSIEKYGAYLDVKGTPEYKEQLISVAVKNGLNVSFKEKEMNQQFALQKEQFNKGENLITKAEITYKTNASQSEKDQQQEQKAPSGWSR